MPGGIVSKEGDESLYCQGRLTQQQPHLYRLHELLDRWWVVHLQGRHKANHRAQSADQALICAYATFYFTLLLPAILMRPSVYTLLKLEY